MSGDELAPVSDGAGEDIVGRAAWEVQRVINHWSAVPPDVLAEREAELADLRACRDRIVALAPAPTQAPQADETLAGEFAAAIGGIDGDEWADLTPRAQDACRRAAKAALDALATHVPTIRADAEQAAARTAWENALQAVAWCLRNGSADIGEVLTYVGGNNPHKPTESTS